MTTTTRRPVLSLTPRGVSLEEWESKAPLKEEELQSVGRVKDGCLDRRLPPKVSARSFHTYISRNAGLSKTAAEVDSAPSGAGKEGEGG